MSPDDRAGESRKEPSYVRAVTEHKPPERLVDIKERVGSWRTYINFNNVTEEQYEEQHEAEVAQTIFRCF